MQFILTAYDYPHALEKRLAARPAHLELVSTLHKEGKLIFGGAILDDKGAMIGSTLICNFPDRQALDQWLKIEPFMLSGVWEKVTILPFKTGPAFAHDLD